MKIAKNITELIGNTPLIRLNTASEITGTNIIAKCEFMNPTSSVKDRIGFNMIRRAMEAGKITQTTTIIEPTSGNTGVALAANCAALGLNLVLTMPESMSMERRKLLKAFGAELVLTPAIEGMRGAIKKADELNIEIEDSIVLQQFKNKSNPEIHMLTTAREILRDTDKKVDAFIAAVGTGGTLSGTAKVLKEEISNIAIFAVEPESSAVLSGGPAGPHAIQGIGAGFIPDILDTTIYGEVIKVSNENAIKTARMLAKKEGLLVGISAGANVYATMMVASREEFKGKTLLTILCDTGERYLSTDLFSV
ncbi:MAG: cysteine synthase A [Sulfurimonas sp. RIFOXYD12_FULL_33_39]|uniref:cysteine synthase A n=1 Tax=unclassified Sulfurimonas TaxID=2623549 RepID=UPI0008BD456A|nr:MULTISPECIES: cysteine synthase A [unclassified Sulfurimonas]OHE06329.1 MAG: cysteine synthase A [Sulfurimonas sp. RIFCSPLOWO2_12_FULL_34_6]OHE09598.1 MAG: cysteine synthase A [Sulfurimonas sp. RIFOXYD12_FULL_33_39]OHE13895.1 MAG: cysteine synthase A [Sulfurimonas sp. RIFOXYD2_FULL_34_21]DAB28557.1 MAG TPA: cysteine synthase A [Sulfurimonas sp. UBA10385]